MAAWSGIAPFLKQAKVGDFLASVAESAPFLNDLMRDSPARLAKLLSANPERRLKQVLAATAKAWKGASEAELMAALRLAKQEVALLAALADLGGVWTLQQVTGALSDFADAAIGAAVRFLLAGAAERGDLLPGDSSDPATGSGWIVLGMGKLGAGELNYSSDIDLIVLYDTQVTKLAPEREPSMVFVRLTKRLVHILHERTERRLCLPHRPPTASRSGLDQHRPLRRCGAPVLREPRPELGARCADQGPAGGR